MMRVLHYIPSIDRSSGGVGSYMQLLAKPLGELVELHVVTHKSENMLDITNATVHYIDGGMRRVFKAKKQWEDILDRIKPDVVHENCCWIPMTALTQRWAHAKGYKVVLTPHGMLEPWILRRHYLTKKLPALMLFQRSSVRNTDVLHATAESEKQNLLCLGWNKNVEMIANGIAVDSIELKTSWVRSGKILFLSRVHVKKGINYLIEAFAALEAKGYILQIAGEGDESYVNELKALAASRGIADCVQFLGGVYGNRKWELFREADVFVLPTHSENFGIVVGEALASGTPVITTQGTPWSELVSAHCGWWTEVGAEPTLNALREFMGLSVDELQVMGINGRKLIADKYSDRFVASEMVKMYKRLLEKQ